MNSAESEGLAEEVAEKKSGRGLVSEELPAFEELPWLEGRR